MKKLIVMIIVIAALNITLYAIDSTSIYAELSTDTIVSRPLLAPYSGTVLIERNINLPIKAQVLFQSDGRIFPYNKLGPAGILIRVDGMDISNESKIDFRSGTLLR